MPDEVSPWEWGQGLMWYTDSSITVVNLPTTPANKFSRGGCRDSEEYSSLDPAKGALPPAVLKSGVEVWATSQKDLLGESGPGLYTVIHDQTAVTPGIKLTNPTAFLPKGVIIQVLEVTHSAEQGRLRGRIEKPNGWISLANLEDGYCWTRKLARDLETSTEATTAAHGSMGSSELTSELGSFSLPDRSNVPIAMAPCTRALAPLGLRGRTVDPPESRPLPHKEAMQLLNLQSPNGQHACTGVYKLVNEHVNGQPLWKQQDGNHWLYCGLNGRWCVAGMDVRKEGFKRSAGFISQTEIHKDKLPYEYRSPWQRWEWEGTSFAKDPAIAITVILESTASGSSSRSPKDSLLAMVEEGASSSSSVSYSPSRGHFGSSKSSSSTSEVTNPPSRPPSPTNCTDVSPGTVAQLSQAHSLRGSRSLSVPPGHSRMSLAGLGTERELPRQARVPDFRSSGGLDNARELPRQSRVPEPPSLGSYAGMRGNSFEVLLECIHSSSMDIASKSRWQRCIGKAVAAGSPWRIGPRLQPQIFSGKHVEALPQDPIFEITWRPPHLYLCKPTQLAKLLLDGAHVDRVQTPLAHGAEIGICLQGSSSPILSLRVVHVANEDQGIPHDIQVTSPHKQALCSGLYILLAGEMANGRPIWEKKASSRWIYSGTDGRWYVGGPSSREKGFQCSTGFLYHNREHGSMLPHQLRGAWCWGDNGAWHEDTSISVTAVQSADLADPVPIVPEEAGHAVMDLRGCGLSAAGRTVVQASASESLRVIV